MPFIPRLLLVLCLLSAAAGRCQETVRFRQWVGGQETGGSEVRISQDAKGRRIDSREWMRMERLGLVVEQEVKQTLWKAQDGAIQAEWSVRLAEEPMEGTARWSPGSPASLEVIPKGMTPRTLSLPAGTLLWPEDMDAAEMAAAAARRPLSARGYTISIQQPTALDLTCLGPAPLPGFPDAVRFQGKSQEGPITEDVELWVSPSQGELRHQGRIMGTDFLVQRAELPPPGASTGTQQFFESTLSTLQPHPMRLWLQDLTVTWAGEHPPVLREDPQQVRLGPGRYRLRRAQEPTPQEAAEAPVSGPVKAEDAPFLASTPLVRLEDPVFDGLLARLGAPPGASRWELARQVVDFVFEWIENKDYSVGFATAQEVARNAKGDCTEHGVLAIALLRRLGVPCRAVSGWAALDDTLGLHFWVEVKLKDRWVPIDPTFDQAPASAFRIKLSVSDLADLGSLGWEGAGSGLQGGGWQMERPWPQGAQAEGERFRQDAGPVLIARGKTWIVTAKGLQLAGRAPVRAEASIRPSPQELRGARKLMGTSGRIGWWQPDGRHLWLELPDRQWLRLAPVEQGATFELIDNIFVERVPPVP